ncbi:MAG TPA: ABC transporter ATP-binding protein, partial [Patescibacteria group bacterium]|nr:ABC transporter ATP-binding protein [Patescibacteria group bacterium]
ADVALLSASPVVLIDEIENAGVDRKRALELLVSKDKIVLISTHDPLLALRGGRRIVIRNGGIAEVMETSEVELRTLRGLEEIDAKLMDIRDRLRGGQRVEAEIEW